MRAPRDIVKHVEAQIAQRRRKCHRNEEHQIAQGELCIVVKERSFNGTKNYCGPCALEIISAAEKKLGTIRGQFENAKPPL
jgi:hypothetical protein